MSQFQSLNVVRESLCQTTQRFSWEQHVSELEGMRAMSQMPHVLERRLAHVAAAMQLTGPTPTLAELIHAIRAQKFGSPVHQVLLSVAAEHVAYLILRCAWPYSTVLTMIKAAREYQLDLCEPLAGCEDHSNGVLAEMANFAEGWLATL